MELDDTICYCFHISKRKIINFLRIYRPRRASQLSNCGGAGTGCGWCVPYLKRYYADVCEADAAAAQAQRDAVSPEEYARQRAAYIRAGKGVPAAGAIPLPTPPAPDDTKPAGE